MSREPDEIERRAMAHATERDAGRRPGQGSVTEPGSWDDTIAGRVAARFRPVPAEIRSGITEADVSEKWLDHVGGTIPPERRAQLDAAALVQYHRDPRRVISAEIGDVFGEVRAQDPRFGFAVVHPSAAAGMARRETAADGSVTYTGDPEICARMREADQRARERQRAAWSGPRAARLR